MTISSTPPLFEGHQANNHHSLTFPTFLFSLIPPRLLCDAFTLNINMGGVADAYRG
jgi:hypothetical protein